MGIFDAIASEIAKDIKAIASTGEEVAEDFSKVLPPATSTLLGEATKQSLNQDYGKTLNVDFLNSKINLLSLKFPEPKTITVYIGGAEGKTVYGSITYGVGSARKHTTFDIGPRGNSITLCVDSFELTAQYIGLAPQVPISVSWGEGVVSESNQLIYSYGFSSNPGDLVVLNVVQDPENRVTGSSSFQVGYIPRGIKRFKVVSGIVNTNPNDIGYAASFGTTLLGSFTVPFPVGVSDTGWIDAPPGLQYIAVQNLQGLFNFYAVLCEIGL